MELGPSQEQPTWDDELVGAPSRGVLDVWVSPFDSDPTNIEHAELRVFADADPAGIADAQSRLRNAGVSVDPVIYTCPFTRDGYDAVQEYLRSFEWSDDNGARLDSPRFAPYVAEAARHGWGRCPLLFPLEQLSAEEVDRIRTFALANGVDWIDFWAGAVAGIGGEPLGLPPGGLPSIRLPAPCGDQECTGEEMVGQ